MKSSLLTVGLIVLLVFLWLQSQGKTRGMQTRRLVPRPGSQPSCGLANVLKKLLGSQQSGGKSSGGGGSSGGGSGGGSGSRTAGGQRSCNKTPGSAFCGCASCLAFAGVDANGNEIYQTSCGSLVYSDGSEATQADIADNTGACVGTVCNPTVPDPQCVSTAQPDSGGGACASCCSSDCFVAQCFS